MERTKPSKNKTPDLQTLSALVARAKLAGSLGTQQFQGDRDIYQALGYKTEINFIDYFARYKRQDIAKAIIDRPVNAVWQGDLEILEVDDENETPFEKAWNELNTNLGLKTRFARVDRLVGIGRYAILLFGLSDVQNQEGFALPVKGNKLKLLYVKPFSEESAKIQKYVTDTKDKRFGMPEIYQLQIQESENGNQNTVLVHHSRVIHIVDDVLESEIEGSPRLEAVFNRLMDLEKIVGGDAEMFWRGARPGFQAKLDKEYQATPQTSVDIQDQLDEYEHNLRRFFVNQGYSFDPLAQQVVDPTAHVTIQLQMISAETKIPMRILVGSERGQLASGQDADEWDSFVQNRRDEHAEPHIIRPFVERCISYGILPQPGTEKYIVKWSDLFAESEKERVDIGQKRATAISTLLSNPMVDLPMEVIMEFFAGFDSGQIDLIMQMIDSQVEKEPVMDVPVEQPPVTMVRTKRPIVYGGPGSGNFDHAGIPGEQGGSAPSGSGGFSESELNNELEKKEDANWDKIEEIRQLNTLDLDTDLENIDLESIDDEKVIETILNKNGVYYSKNEAQTGSIYYGLEQQGTDDRFKVRFANHDKGSNGRMMERQTDADIRYGDGISKKDIIDDFKSQLPSNIIKTKQKLGTAYFNAKKNGNNQKLITEIDNLLVK